MRDCVGIIVASNTLMDPCTAGQTLGGPDPCGVDAYGGIAGSSDNGHHTVIDSPDGMFSCSENDDTRQ